MIRPAKVPTIRKYRDAIARKAEQAGYVPCCTDPARQCGACTHLEETPESERYCHELLRWVQVGGTCRRWQQRPSLTTRLVNGIWERLFPQK